MKNPTRKRYLHSTALVAMTQLMLIPAAQATDYGLHHPDGSHLILNVAAGQSYTGNLTGILAEFGRASITNAGTIRGNGGSDSPTSLPDSGIILGQANSSVVNSGTISGTNTGITTIYAWDGVAGAHLGKARNTIVENTGSIIGDNNDGVRLIGGGTVANTGVIEGRTSPWADGISIYAFAGQDTTGQTSLATVTNAAGATIAGARFGLALSVGAAVENDGAITGDVGGVMIQSDPDQPHLSATVANRATISGGDGLWFGGYLASATVTNSGTIEGTGNAGIFHGATSTLTLTNATDGTITGALSGVMAEYGAVIIDNAGTIRGNGTSDSATSLPDGGIVLAQPGSKIVNSGTISGANVGITTISAWDDDAGAPVGKARNTIVENTGSIIGDNNDGVRLIGGGTVANSGTIEGRTSPWADGISIYAFAGQDTTGQTSLATVTNAAGGTIAGARFGLALSVGAAVENDGAITGDVGGVTIQSDPDQPHLSATVANRATISGGDGLWFGGYLASAAVTNSGTIEGTGNAGIFHGATSTLTLTNATDGTITGALSGVMAEYGAVIIDNAGTIRGNGTSDSATSLPDGGIVLAQPGSKIVNSGTISGANVGITTISAWDDDAGAPVGKARNTIVENTGSIIGDNNDGVRLIGGGTVANSGTIEGRTSPWADGISIYAFADQDTTGQTSLATVTNAAGGTIAGARFGLALSAGGNIENDGMITGDVGGLFIQSESRQPDMVGTVTNRGTITGGDGVQFIGYLKSADLTNTGVITGTSGAAVFSVTQTTLTNAGTLEGADGTAVLLGDYDDTVTLMTGSKVVGLIDAGAGDDLLRLSGTSGTATAGQTLTRADGFETLHVASGYWSTEGWVGAFDGVSIDAGATLRVNQANLEDGAWSPIHTNQVVNHGLLVFNIDDVEAFDGAEDLVISGAGTVRLDGEAILHVANSNIRHTGGTEIANGGIVLTGTLAGDVTTSNDGVFVIGDGGTDGIFTGNLVNNGQFVFNRTDDYDFLGNFSGSGSFEKRGAGTLTFAGGYNFTGVTRILDGFVKFAGEMDPGTQLDVGSGALDLSGGQHTVAGLAGTGGSINIDNGALTVNQASNTEFAGAIAGSGGFNKTGSGRLNLTGTSTYSGPTTVSDGTLSVNGSVASTVTVEGGALGGNGTVGGIVAATGGTVAPGNSIGHLRVAGNVAFTDGSVYAVETTADGEADRITATGSATISGGTLSVLAAEGRYAARTGYTVLIAENGITGTFSEVTSNLAFLTPVLSYGNTSVTLDLLRNDISFASLAATANQRQSAAAVQALGAGNSLFEAILVQDATGAQAAFDALSGELYPSVSAGLLNDSRHIRDAVLANVVLDGQGTGLWGQVLGSWGAADAHEGMARLSTDHQGVIVGVSRSGNGFAVGFAAGLSNADYRAGARASSADVSSQFLAVHGGLASGALSLQIGGAYAWHDVDASRSIVFPGYSGSVTAEYDASTRQLFGELAYGIPAGGLTLSPFARLAHTRTRTDGFAERGASEAALNVASQTRTLDLLSLGLKLDGSLEISSSARLAPAISVAWQRAWGDRMDAQDVRFTDGTAGFAIQGQQVQRTSAVVDAGVALDLGAYTIGAAYRGAVADRWADHGAKLTLGLRF